MSTSLEKLIADLRGFDNRKEVLKELRKEIRKPLPRIRAAIKQRALDTLPQRGGLNEWAAATKILMSIRLSARAVGVKIKAGRNSQGARSDIRALDRGRVRHPSWGRRYAGQWHNQTVEPGFVTKPVTETDEWRNATEAAVANAVRSLSRG